MDSAAIEEVNKEDTGGKRKRYLKLTDEQRATIGHYAAKHGTANTIRHFTGDFPPVRLFKGKYNSWVEESLFTGTSIMYKRGERQSGKKSIKRKTGRPLMMGEEP